MLFITFAAARCSYCYLQLQREKAVKVALPTLPELGPNWQGIGWDQVCDEDRKILEGQKNGVGGLSCLYFEFFQPDRTRT